MEILQFNEIDMNKFDNYILSIDLKNHLDFYKLSDNSKYLEILKKIIFEKESISLIAVENDFIIGFMIGEIEFSDELSSKIAKVKYTIYENSSNYEMLLNRFEQIAKEKNCEYVSVCTPYFQKDTLDFLSSTGFSNYKIELEKELV